MRFWNVFFKSIINPSIIYKNKYKRNLNSNKEFRTLSEAYNEYSQESFAEGNDDSDMVESNSYEEKSNKTTKSVQEKIKNEKNLNFDREVMRKAVIYSEILGKPKAKVKRKRWR